VTDSLNDTEPDSHYGVSIRGTKTASYDDLGWTMQQPVCDPHHCNHSDEVQTKHFHLHLLTNRN